MATTLSSFVEGARHGGFPDLSFLDFAVAQHDVSARWPAIQARRQAHPERQRQAFAERAGGSLEAGMKRTSGWPWYIEPSLRSVFSWSIGV